MTDIISIVNAKTRVLRGLTDNVFDLAYGCSMFDESRPPWCLLPIGNSIGLIETFVEAGTPEQKFGLVSAANLLSCIGAWRLTQDIIRFDKTLLDAIISTPITGELPIDVFFRMPAWCIFVEYEKPEFIGFFFALEKTLHDEDPELRIWWVTHDGDFVSTPIHLGKWSLDTALKRSLDYATAHFGEHIEQYEDKYLHDAINMILYLCTQNAEYSPTGSRPSRPAPKKTKKGIRFFQADKPKIWNVGNQIGEKLRQDIARTGNHKAKRPHIRRAHWHGFYSGPKSAPKRDFNLKWLPPIMVGDEEPA